MPDPPSDTEPTRYLAKIVRSGRFGDVVMTREAIEGVAEQLKRRPVPMNVEHDPTHPPIGRMHYHSMVELEDGEVAIEGLLEVTERVGTLFVPLGRLDEVHKALPDIAVTEGPIHLLSGMKSYAASDLENIASGITAAVKVDADKVGRFSVLPDALLVIGLGAPAVALFWFSKGFFTKFGEAMGDDAGHDTYRLLKAKIRDVVSKRRNPPDQPPLTMMTLELPRGKDVVVVEGSSKATEAELEAFLDSGSDLLVVARVFAQLVPNPASLAKLHFAFSDGRWEFRYGLDDEANRVHVVVVTDEHYEVLLTQARRQGS